MGWWTDFTNMAGRNIVNPIGAADAGGAALNYLGRSMGLDNSEQVAQGQAGIDELMAEAARTGLANRGIYDDYLGQMQDIYGQGASQYGDAVQRLADAIGEGPSQFSYQGNVNDFYDKFANQAQQAAMQALNKSSAAGGARWSSDYMNNLANQQRTMASDQWAKAYDRMMQDRQQQLSEWQAGQAANQNYLNNLGTVAGLYGNDRNQLANAYGDYYGNVASQNNADLQTRTDLAQARTNLGMQQKTGAGALLGGVGNILGGIFGA